MFLAHGHNLQAVRADIAQCMADVHRFQIRAQLVAGMIKPVILISLALTAQHGDGCAELSGARVSERHHLAQITPAAQARMR